MPSDAAFREALEEFADAYYYYRDCWASESTRVDAARARVLALYDEASRGMTPEESAQYKAFLRSRFKSAERQGEEGMVVMNKYGDLYVNVTPQHFENGDRMSDERERLVRAVEEAHHIEDKVFAVYDEVSDKTIEAEAALAAYDAAHPEEAK